MTTVHELLEVEAHWYGRSSSHDSDRLFFTQFAMTAISLGALARVKPGCGARKQPSGSLRPQMSSVSVIWTSCYARQLPGQLARIPPGFSDSAQAEQICKRLLIKTLF